LVLRPGVYTRLKRLLLRREVILDQLHPRHHRRIRLGRRGVLVQGHTVMIAAPSAVMLSRSPGSPRRDNFTCSWA